MPDEPEILDEVITPAEPIRRPGSPHVRGIGEGFAIAVILVLLAGGMGLVAVTRPSSAIPSASSIAVGATSTPEVTPQPSPSPSPVPTLGPAVTPATACAATPPSVPPIAVVHSDRFRYMGAPTAAGWLKTPDPSRHASPPADASTVLAEPLIVSFGDRVWCALAWRFLLDGAEIAHQDNPRLDPGYAAQNSWSLRLPALDDPVPTLRIELEFPSGWTVDEWALTFNPAPIPEAFVATGDAVAPALPGCGFQITLRNGAAFADTCATTVPAEVPDTLFLEPGEQVAFRVPNAAFTPDPHDEVPVLCGELGGQPPDLLIDDACSLEVIDDPSNAVTFVAPDAAALWWVAIVGCTTRDGNVACGRWYTLIDTRPPAEPTGPGTPP
jgi:hypothetical protein